MSIIITVGATAYKVACEINTICKAGADLSLSLPCRICNISKEGTQRRQWKYNPLINSNILKKLSNFFENSSLSTFHIFFLFSEVDGLAFNVLNCLLTSFPSLQITSIYLPLLSSRFSNSLEAMDEVLTLQLALHASREFMIRSIEETLSFLIYREHKNISLSLIYHTIASDLALLLTAFYSSPSIFRLPVTSKSKCIDFRSSFWATTLPLYLKPIRTKPSSSSHTMETSSDSDFPKNVRNMSINIHSMYLHHEALLSHSTSELIYGDVYQFRRSKSGNRVSILPSLSNAALPELKVAMDWATPGLKYSIFDPEMAFFHCEKSTDVLPTLEAGKGIRSIAAGFVFESWTAKQRLRNSGEIVRRAVLAGTYLHIFERDLGKSASSVAEDLLEAVDTVLDYAQ